MKVAEKLCKECGKPFQPTNSRQQYCTREHYRPCPVCGKPILIKYLSDPTPRCEECRSAARPKKPIPLFKLPEEPKPDAIAPVPKADPQTTDLIVPKGPTSVLQYVGNAHKNYFVPGHVYEVIIDHTDTVYWVTASLDMTDDKEVSISAPFSSQVSINHNFVAQKG